MASKLNRPAIFLDLAAFIGVSLFSIATEPPTIQQDILKRCQDILLAGYLPTRGLSVDGRDVNLTGGSGSAIINSSVVAAITAVDGVRTVHTHLSLANPDGNAYNPRLPQKIQEKIDQVVKNQVISFRTDSTALTPESELALNRVAAYLGEAPGLLCEIRGYDIQSSETRQNWVLALRRALSTKEYLETQGIAELRLSTRALHASKDTGENGPVRQIDFMVRARD